jgi:protein TonB
MMRLSTAYGISALAHVAILAAVHAFLPSDYAARPYPVSGGGGLSIEFMPHGLPGAVPATSVVLDLPKELPLVEEVFVAQPLPSDLPLDATTIRTPVARDDAPSAVAAEAQTLSIDGPKLVPAAAHLEPAIESSHTPDALVTPPSHLPSRRVARQAPTAGATAAPMDVAIPNQTKGNGGGGGVLGGAVDSLPQKGPFNLPPDYPSDALLARAEGRVLLRADVGSDGLVDDLAVEDTSGWPSMDDAALKAVRRWRFVPARRGGVAVACQVLVPVRFSIRDQ